MKTCGNVCTYEMKSIHIHVLIMVKYSILSDFSVSVCIFVAFLHREFRLKNQTNKDSKEEDEKKRTMCI